MPHPLDVVTDSELVFGVGSGEAKAAFGNDRGPAIDA
jgi:hypothetical protein